MTQPQPAPPAAEETAPLASFKSIMFGSGPRFAREGFGPVIGFYVGWKAVGLMLGIVLATAIGLLAYWAARREERTGNMAKLALGFVLLQAIVGLISNSATAYLAQPVLLSGGLGIAFLVSALMGRPLAGVFAEETYPFPPEVRASDTFRQVFGRVSIGWGVYLLLRSAVRIVVLTQTSVDAYVAINFATGAPLMALMMTWSFWYGVRGFRRSEEWGWALG
jgi:intracellular septation protein A